MFTHRSEGEELDADRNRSEGQRLAERSDHRPAERALTCRAPRLIAEAVAALRKVLPDLPEKEAVREVILAIAYAAREPTYWFWTGVGGR
jgi:hypothetical protein